MTIDTGHLVRCINVLETAFERLLQLPSNEVTYDIYRAACVKEFELVLEQGGKLLRMRLREYFASNLEVDRLAIKDVFRHAVRRGLPSIESCERWFDYRDNRNNTAHDYGEGFAETALTILPAFIPVFIEDAKHLASVIGSVYQYDGYG